MVRPTLAGGRYTATETFERALPCARRADRGEAVVLVDVQPLAAILARHGASAAEQAQRAVAECLRRCLRAEDRLAAIRTDGFLAVLPGATETSLPAIADRLGAGVRGMRLSLGGTTWALECLVGGAARESRALCIESLVRAADGALDRARRRRSASA